MSLLADLRQYLYRDIWMEDLRDRSPQRRLLPWILRAIVLAARGIGRHRVSMWASSLTYITLISVVPFAALMIGVGASLGVPAKAVGSLTDPLPAEQAKFLTDMAESFQNMDMKALGVVAVLMLLYAIVKALSQVENAFNEIWGVERGRGFVRRVANYLSVAVVAPLFVFAGMALTASLMSSAVVQQVEALPVAGWAFDLLLFLAPFLAVWIALTVLYWFMPNTKVKFTSALVGALVAAILWQLAQTLYFGTQVGISQLGVVYGAFAAIPVFLIWVFVSWMIVLIGTEICYGTQHAAGYAFERIDTEPSSDALERTALRIAALLADRLDRGDAPPDADAVALALGVPARLVSRLLGAMAAAGLVSVLEGGGCQIGRSPDRMTVADVVDGIRGQGSSIPLRADTPEGAAERIDALSDKAREALSVPLRSLLDGSETGGAEP